MHSEQFDYTNRNITGTDIIRFIFLMLLAKVTPITCTIVDDFRI